MAVYVAKDSYFGQEFVDSEGDGSKIQVNAFGMPSGVGTPCLVGTSEENAPYTPGVDPQKRTLMVKFWWDEAEKSLKSKFIYDESKLTMDQTRRIDENDVLHFFHSCAKPDGSSVSYTATLKRMAK